MSKRILLFPGQGSQYLGMGKAVADAHAPSKKLLDQASEILGFDLSDLLWNAPEDRLTQTQNTQPALFVVSCMALEWVKHKGISFDFVAGHSLGEYSALYAANALTFEAGLKLVRKRGELMASAGEKMPGAMAAVLGLEKEKLTEVLQQANQSGLVVAANFNSLTQIVISGSAAGVEAAILLCESAGAKKVVRLPVSGAFHSPLMNFAVSGLRESLAQVQFTHPNVPVITNVEAEPQSNEKRFADLLLQQMTSPVRWVESMQKAQSLGVTEALEVGTGKVLMGLLRGITRDIKVMPVEGPADLP